MTAMALEIDQHWSEAKLQRASRRAHSVHKDRQDYNRVLAKREKSQKEDRTSSMPASCRHARPHGAARAVARSWLAKGEVTCETDMPSISIGHPDMHKPTATRLASCKRQSQKDEVDSDVETSVPDDRVSAYSSPTLSCLEDHPVYEELSQEDSLGEPALALEPEYSSPGDQPCNWIADADSGTLQFAKAEQQGPVRTNRFGDMSVDSHSTTWKLRGYAVLDRLGDISVLAHTTHSQPRSHCLNNRFGDMSVNCHSTTWKLRGYCVSDRFGDFSADSLTMNSNAESSHETPCASHETPCAPHETPCVSREQILREVVSKLRLQAREAEQEAGEAKAHVQEVQEKAAAQHLKEEFSARKQAMQTEKQRVAQLRKQRNQAAHLDAIQGKADRALQEAAAIREQAQDDAISMRAQVLAKASKEAHEQAEMHREAELLAAQAEAEALKADSWEAAKQAEILKAEAAAEAEALKMLAGKEQAAAAETKAQAVAMHAEAERAARMIREEALEDVVALKARVFDQLREKAEAENKARQEASEEFAKESARLAALSEADAKCKAAAAALKLGKAMQQQNARKIHKQSEQERRQCVELDAMKAVAEAEMQDIKQKALYEVAAMKTKAKADAKEARTRAIAAAKTEALERAQAEAAALRAAAEKEAELIKAKAARDVEELMRQAQTAALPVPQEETLDDNCLPAVAAVAVDECDLEADEDWQLLPAEVPAHEDWDLLVDDALMIV